MSIIRSLTTSDELYAILSIVFYLLHDIVGSINYPGYDWMSQAVSDLTATDAPSFVVASGFVTVYKIFSCLASALLCILVKNRCSVSCFTHNLISNYRKN